MSDKKKLVEIDWTNNRRNELFIEVRVSGMDLWIRPDEWEDFQKEIAALPSDGHKVLRDRMAENGVTP